MQNKKFDLKLISLLFVIFVVTYIIVYYVSGFFINTNQQDDSRTEYRIVNPSNNTNNQGIDIDTIEEALENEEIDTIQTDSDLIISEDSEFDLNDLE